MKKLITIIAVGMTLISCNKIDRPCECREVKFNNVNFINGQLYLTGDASNLSESVTHWGDSRFTWEDFGTILSETRQDTSEVAGTFISLSSSVVITQNKVSCREL